MTDTMTDEKALGLVRWLLNGSDATPPPPDVTLEQAYNHIAARLAQQPTHSLSHECPEWDGLRITPDMPEWEACGCFVVSGVAQQPAAAVPDMAAFDKAVSDLNSWAIVYGRLSTDANLRALVEAREAVKALHAQALASRVQVPEVTRDALDDQDDADLESWLESWRGDRP